MVIYADILFILNLMINYYLLLLTKKLASAGGRTLRLLGGAGIGAAASFAVFLPGFSFLLSALGKAAISLLIVVTAFGFGTKRRFFRLFATFFISTFSFAGIMLALWNIFNIKSLAIHNGIVYFDISPVVLIISTGAAYVIMLIIGKLTRRNVTARREAYRISVTLGGIQAEFNALLDTGNNLSDAFSFDPVIVAEYSLVRELLPPEARGAFEYGISADVPKGLESRYRVIPYMVVGGHGMLPAVRLDSARVKAPGYGPVENAVLAVSSGPLGGEHRAIFGKELLLACADTSGFRKKDPLNFQPAEKDGYR